MKVSVMDYGAIGDGVHDDFAAFQNALSSGAEEIIIPQGIYAISETLQVPSDTSILADETAKIVMKPKTRRRRNHFLLCNSDTENGNRNICICGGIWDGNNTAKENEKPDIREENGFSGAVLNFVHVENLKLSHMVVANSVTYYVRMSRLHHFEMEHIDFVSDTFGKNQDGLHFGGDVKHGRVKNIRALSFGQTNDDLIALNADDSVERVENRDLARDVIEDIEFDNLYAECCHTVIRLLSVTAPIRNIRIRNVYGGFRCYALNADAARYCATPLFHEEDYPEGVGIIENVSIENFTCRPFFENPEGWQGTQAAPNTAICIESCMKNFRISGFRHIGAEAAPDGYCVLMARNVANGKITADGQEHMLKNKNDSLMLDTFRDLIVNI